LWIKFKRIILIVIGAITVLLGAGTAVSAIFGSFDESLGLTIGLAIGGSLAMVLGGFLLRIGTHGTDDDVSNTDLF
jgi:hypothetical protein